MSLRGPRMRQGISDGVGRRQCTVAFARSPQMHVTGRVSCSKTLLERLLLLLLWGLSQPHNDLWDLCHRPVTAVELGGKQRRIATRTQDSIYAVANHSAHQSRGDKGGNAGVLPLLPLLTGRNVFRWRPRRTPRVNNPINAKYNTPLKRSATTSYKRVCLPLRLCFGDLQDYFFMGTTLHPQQLLYTGSTVAMAIFEPGKEEKREREKMRDWEREWERDWGEKRIACVERVGE